MKVLRNGVEIADHDLKALQHDLLNVEDWMQGAIAGKVYAAKSRLIDEWFPVILADPDVKSVPANEPSLIELITSRADYKNRVARESEFTT
jgi:hypothetical protein